MELEQQLRNHPNAICKQGVAKDHIELRAQQQRRATLMQPLQYNLQTASYKRP